MVRIPDPWINVIPARHCQERGRGLIDVRFRHRVTGVGQDADKAWADVEISNEQDEEKHAERFEADYVIGCDGATSAVRHSLFGREWPGQTFDFRFLVQNVSDGFGDRGCCLTAVLEVLMMRCRFSMMDLKSMAGYVVRRSARCIKSSPVHALIAV